MNSSANHAILSTSLACKLYGTLIVVECHTARHRAATWLGLSVLSSSSLACSHGTRIVRADEFCDIGFAHNCASFSPRSNFCEFVHGHRYKLSVLLQASAQQPSVRRARCHQLKRGALQRWCHEASQLVPRAETGNRVDYQNNLVSMQHSVTLQSGHQTSQLLVLSRHQYTWICARRSTQVRKLPKQLCQAQVGSKHCRHGRAAIYIACSSSSGAFVDQAPHSSIEVSRNSQYIGLPVLRSELETTEADHCCADSSQPARLQACNSS